MGHVDGDGAAVRVAQDGELRAIRLDPTWIPFQPVESILHGINRVLGEGVGRCEPRGLVLRIDDDVALLHQVFQPEQIRIRRQSAPPMQKDDHRRLGRLRLGRLIDPVLAVAEAALHDGVARVGVVAAAGTIGRLTGWRWPGLAPVGSNDGQIDMTRQIRGGGHDVLDVDHAVAVDISDALGDSGRGGRGGCRRSSYCRRRRGSG